MGAVKKSEPVIRVAEFLRGINKEVRMAGTKGKRRGVATPEAKKHMTLREIRTLLGHPDPAKREAGKAMPLEAFADAIGSTRSTVWFWEQNRRPIPPKYEARIQALLINYAREHAQAGNGNGNGASAAEEKPTE